MNPLPDPEFDALVGGNLFLANLFIHGQLTQYDIKNKEVSSYLSGFPAFNSTPSTETIFCFYCTVEMGVVNGNCYGRPIVCSSCFKKFGANHCIANPGIIGLQNFRPNLKAQVINYLIAFGKQQKRKGTWHKVSQIN